MWKSFGQATLQQGQPCGIMGDYWFVCQSQKCILINLNKGDSVAICRYCFKTNTNGMKSQDYGFGKGISRPDVQIPGSNIIFMCKNKPKLQCQISKTLNEQNKYI